MTGLRGRAMLLGTMFALAAPIAAKAQVVIDQDELIPNDGRNSFSVTNVGYNVFPPGFPPSQEERAQTFTAGTTGILDHLDFQASLSGTSNTFTGGTFVLSLFDGDISTGTASLLYTASGAISTLPGSPAPSMGPPALSFDVRAANYAVTPGQRYSILFSAVPGLGGYSLLLGTGEMTGTGPFVFVTYGNDYAGGAYYDYAGGQVVSPAYGTDVGFVSWVDVSASAVPEPAGWAFMILGFGGVGAATRRRVRATSPAM